MESKSGIFDARATVKEVGDGSGAGEFEAILSVPSLDRDGEVIDAKAFEPLPPEGIVIHKDHNFSVDSAVAWANVAYQGDQLVARGFFSSDPDSQIVRTKVKEGIIRTMSVGFMDATRKSVDGTPHITGGELLEASFVSVPSNRDAMILSAKSAVGAVESDRARHYKTLDGSLEQRTELLTQAIYSNHADAWYVRIVGTYDDSVIYRINDDATLQASYQFTDGALTLEAGAAVDVAEVLAPAKSAPVPDLAAAPAAADPAQVLTRTAVARAEADALSVL